MEMVALSRLSSILYLCICVAVRWLSGKTHTLREYNWGARSMGCVVEILEEKLKELTQDIDMILNKRYVMGFFEDFEEELPPFKKN